MNRCWMIAGCIASWMSLFGASLVANEIETLALVGRPLPSAPELVLNSLPIGGGPVPSVVMNQQGEVVFTGVVTQQGDARPTLGLFSIADQQFKTIVRSGDPVPGIEPLTAFGSLMFPSLAEDGTVAFQAVLTGNAANNTTGIWIARDQLLTPVVLRGQEAPGFSSSSTFDSTLVPRVNSSGEVAFLGSINGASTLGMFAHQGGAIHKIAFPGEPAYGVMGDFLGFNIGQSFVIDEMGRTVFTNLTSAGGNERSIWRDDQLLVTQGHEIEMTPGSSGPAKALDFFQPEPIFNSSGVYVLEGVAQTVPPMRGGFSRGLYSGRDGSLRVVAEVSQSAPGAGLNVNFQAFRQRHINSLGEVTFLASLGNTAMSDSVWKEQGENLRLVARQGSAAPGLDQQLLFAQFLSSQNNRHQQTAFMAQVFGGVGGAFRGVWAEDLTGELQLIAAPGTEVEVSPGVTQTIQTVMPVFPNLSLPTPLYFNDRGQVLFRAILDDGTQGLFLSNKVAVPEPSSSAILLLSSVFTLLRLGRFGA